MKIKMSLTIVILILNFKESMTRNCNPGPESDRCNFIPLARKNQLLSRSSPNSIITSIVTVIADNVRMINLIHNQL